MNLEPQLFVGDANDALARVYATLPRDGLPEHAQLTGEFVGPHCRYAQTLPARIRFVDRGRGPTLLAEAIVPDPCFWSPDLPFVYSAELRVQNSNKNATEEIRSIPLRPFGIRRFGVQGLSLYLNAKRFVLRGARTETARSDDLLSAEGAAAALFVSEPSDEFLQEASEVGVLLAVESRSTQPTAELARLGRWPAVAVVVLNSDVPTGKELRLAARNTLLAQRIECANTLTAPAPWAHLLWWQFDANTGPEITPPHDIPIIIYRSDSENATIEESRRACDRLQADLAPLGDFAGYFT